MSRPYRVQLNETVCEQDSSSFRLDPVPLVPPDSMRQILREVFEEAGWKADDEGRLHLQDSPEEEHVFDPETLQITTTVTESKTVRKGLSGWDAREVQQQADKLLDHTQEDLTEQAARHLETTQQERRERFEALLVEATGRALKEAASQLGDVDSIQEERGENGEYRLQINIQEKY